MFGKLKDKLKSFLKKEEKEIEEVVETPQEEEKAAVQKEKPQKSKVEKEEKEKKQPESLPVEVTKEKEEVEEVTTQEEEPVKKKSLFDRFTKKVTEESFEESFEELEVILLQANVAFRAVEQIKESLQERLVGKSVKEVDISKELRVSLEGLLQDSPNIINEIKNKGPFIILCAGINGAGKTTTIAKLAHLFKKEGLSVCFAAADTFRAASIEQISEHGMRLNIPVIKKEYGSDPAAVAFDAIQYAKKNAVDVVLIDTAGRMQNSDTLMKEIQKIVKVSSPDMKLFIGESITGNDCINQAKAFDEAIGLSGIILSKADVDEQGGTALSISYITGKPIVFLGTGQSYDDLEVFDKNKIIAKLGF